MSYSTSYNAYYGSTTITAFLSPNAVPIPTASLSNDFTYTYYVAHCTNPAVYFGSTSGGGGSSGSSGSGSGSSSVICGFRVGCAAPKTWIIIVATVLPSIFLLRLSRVFPVVPPADARALCDAAWDLLLDLDIALDVLPHHENSR